MTQEVTIIGGGVIGLANAYALINEGYHVHLIEANNDVGLGASYANGGQLSYRYVSPLADRGVPLQGLKWMGRADSPLNFHPRFSLSQWQWLFQFLMACRRKTNHINGAHILRLSLLSQATLRKWRMNNKLSNFCWQQSGKMIIHRQQKKFDTAKHEIDPEFQSVLIPTEAIALEPALANIEKELVGAIYSPNDETADAYLFCLALKNILMKSDLFKLSTNSTICDFVVKNHKITAIKTTTDTIPITQLIIATGNGSRELLKPLGISLPLYPLKGYSLTLPLPTISGIVPTISVTDYAHKIVYAKLDEKLRIAAMVDIGYENIGIRNRRIDQLKKIVAKTFPNLDTLDQAEIWTGLRPSTPKGPPILGATQYQNLWLNVGHGSLGFTLAAGSAVVLTALINQEKPPINLNGLIL